jgi:hypothetical protein
MGLLCVKQYIYETPEWLRSVGHTRQVKKYMYQNTNLFENISQRKMKQMLLQAPWYQNI